MVNSGSGRANTPSRGPDFKRGAYRATSRAPAYFEIEIRDAIRRRDAGRLSEPEYAATVSAIEKKYGIRLDEHQWGAPERLGVTNDMIAVRARPARIWPKVLLVLFAVLAAAAIDLVAFFSAFAEDGSPWPFVILVVCEFLILYTWLYRKSPVAGHALAWGIAAAGAANAYAKHARKKRNAEADEVRRRGP